MLGRIHMAFAFLGKRLRMYTCLNRPKASLLLQRARSGQLLIGLSFARFECTPRALPRQTGSKPRLTKLLPRKIAARSPSFIVGAQASGEHTFDSGDRTITSSSTSFSDPCWIDVAKLTKPLPRARALENPHATVRNKREQRNPRDEYGTGTRRMPNRTCRTNPCKKYQTKEEKKPPNT